MTDKPNISPKPEPATHEQISLAIQAAGHLVVSRPKTRELALAVTKLEEAAHWVIADHTNSAGLAPNDVVERVRKALVDAGLTIKSVTEVPSEKPGD